MTAGNGNQLRVAAIQRHVTIFDILDRIGVDVAPETQQMRCPFHPDTSPSARVYADQNKLYCWTCQQGWDVIAAVQTHWKLPFTDALAWIEQEFSVPGTSTGLTSLIRTQLATRVAPNVSQTAAFVEQALQGRKQALGFERYTRCLMALDLTVYEASQQRLTSGELQRRMQAVLTAARRDA